MNPPPHSGSNQIAPTNEEQRNTDGLEFFTLSGNKPFCDVILSWTHLRPRYRMNIPVKMHQILPSATVPLVLTYRGKAWNMKYNGKTKTFDVGWRKFADDNDLKIGDACVFELTEISPNTIVFRTQILRGDIPPEMLAKIVGESKDCPIIIS